MCWACCARRSCWRRISITECRKDFRGWRIFEIARGDVSEVGRARHGAERYGAGDSNVPSGCAGGALFGDIARWAWTSPGIEHSGERGVPGGGGSEAVCGADCRGAAALASEKVLHRKCVRVWGDDLSGCGLDFAAEHGSEKRRAGDVVCAVRDEGAATSDVAGRGELDAG